MLNIQIKGCIKPAQQTNQLLYLITKTFVSQSNQLQHIHHMIIGDDTIIYLLCDKSAVADMKMEYLRE